MNKYQLEAKISDLLHNAIEVHEVIDFKLEVTDRGSLEDMNLFFEQVVDLLRKARRTMRLVLEEYENDLTKKPRNIDTLELDDSIDIDEDEDEEDED
jgi:hypothetical protein